MIAIQYQNYENFTENWVILIKIIKFNIQYRVSHKGWDVKKTWNSLNMTTYKVELSILLWLWSLYGLFNDLKKEQNKYELAGNHEFKKYCSVKFFLQSNISFSRIVHSVKSLVQ